MGPIQFPDWQEVLSQAELPGRLKDSFAITIRWYLSFCRRGRAAVTVQSAREFIEWAAKEKQPQAWQLEKWKEGIRWFFRAAKERRTGAEAERSGGSNESVWLPEDRSRWPEWKVAFLTVVRRRKYSYRTDGGKEWPWFWVWPERGLSQDPGPV